MTDDSTTNATSDETAWRVDDTGRRRFHGSMERHRQPPSHIELHDLDAAMAELAAARAMLVDADNLVDKRERRELRKIALAKVALASRFARDLATRTL
jgi:hypothetical protein